MLTPLTLVLVCALAADATESPSAKVAGIRAEYRHGQTFVTWKDAAEGEAGSGYRYSLYRSEKPITEENLGEAELCYYGVLNNSTTQFGHSYWMKDRLDPAKPRAIAREGGEPLPMWSGIAVRTVKKEGKSYYAIVATDATWQKKLSKVVPGESATTEPVEEKVAPIQPIKIRGAERPISGKAGLPLRLSLHGAQSKGGAASASGDYYIYFGTPEMGWRDGLPGVFSVFESRIPALHLSIRDAIENPNGDRVLQTCWFGYLCVPIGAAHKEPRAYPFTENRLEWVVGWVKDRYKVDANRVYSSGSSMGGMGSTQFAFRNPQTFAAVYPRLGRVRQSWLPGAGDVGLPGITPELRDAARKREFAPMFDGKTNYFDRMDSVKWASEHHEDLPFYGWAFGRQDGVEKWQYQIDMVEALTANRHGFALAWSNGGHNQEGSSGMALIHKYYPYDKFALGQSYPAFTHSSIDSNMGNGDPEDGDLVGGINLGFLWDKVADEESRWSVELANELCKAGMTVDITPRRCQKFRAKPGDKFQWESSAGGKGEVVADRWGLVTIEKVKIEPGKTTKLVISK